MTVAEPQPAAQQLKLAMMAGIDSRVRRVYERPLRAAAAVGLDHADLYRIAAGHHERFSLGRLVDIAELLGAKITVIIE